MRRLAVGMAVLCVAICPLSLLGAEEKDSPKAAKTRELLKKKVTLKFKNEQVGNIVDEIQEQVPGVKFKYDNKGGVSNNRRMSIMCKDITLAEALDMMLGKEDLGYYVISDSKNAYDGLIFIKMGKERGYPLKKD